MRRAEGRDAQKAGRADRVLLIFDCDGVLVDSELIAHEVLAEMMAAVGRPMAVEEALRLFAGRSLKDARRLADTLAGRPIPAEVGALYRDRLLDRLRRELTTVTGVEQALAALPYDKCVASSSAKDRLTLSLARTGLLPVFGDCVYSASAVPRGKPAPDLFLFAAASMAVAPARAIVIEDSPVGIEAARAAGMRAIAFAGASHAGRDLSARLAEAKPDILIHSMAALPKAVERLIAAPSDNRRGKPRCATVG